MKILLRTAAALAAAMSLSGCFLLPGQFGSTLDLRKDGAFAFTYKGEILFQAPDKFGKKAVWNVKGAHCYKDKDMEPYYNDYEEDTVTETRAEDAASAGPMTAERSARDAAAAVDAAGEAASGSDDNARPCTAAEIARLKKDWDAEQAKKAAKDAKEAEQFAQIFGVNPTDDASMQKFAVQLTKQAGWKSATYAGKGKFMVDYAIAGKLDHDFVFPIVGDMQMVMPFVMLQRRADGSVLVSAPAYSAGTLAALGGGLGGMFGSGGMGETKPDQASGAKGQFSITSNAEILTNNTTDGPVVMGKDRKLVWDIGTMKDQVPRALFLVKP